MCSIVFLLCLHENIVYSCYTHTVSVCRRSSVAYNGQTKPLTGFQKDCIGRIFGMVLFSDTWSMLLFHFSTTLLRRNTVPPLLLHLLSISNQQINTSILLYLLYYITLYCTLVYLLLLGCCRLPPCVYGNVLYVW